MASKWFVTPSKSAPTNLYPVIDRLDQTLFRYISVQLGQPMLRAQLSSLPWTTTQDLGLLAKSFKKGTEYVSSINATKGTRVGWPVYL